MPTLMDVAVPPGTLAGEALAFQDATGRTLEAIVPEGLAEGDTFQVEVDDDGSVHPLAALNAYVQERASSGDVMDLFVAWFERESVGEKIDTFVQANAVTIRAGVGAGDGEQSHEWWPLFQDYQAQFDVLLQEFLDESGCAAEDFLAAADKAEGMNDMYLKLFLAHSEYELFIEQISQEYAKQQAMGRG